MSNASQRLQTRNCYFSRPARKHHYLQNFVLQSCGALLNTDGTVLVVCNLIPACFLTSRVLKNRNL